MSEKRNRNLKSRFYKEYINKNLSKTIKPIITEKAIFTNISNNYYTFIFPIYFNKHEISNYLQRVYRIKITKLHTNIYSKKKSKKRIFKKAFFQVKDF
ncbi:50S ribosomal protein L23 [Candidatus Karelsulcia muelleri]